MSSLKLIIFFLIPEEGFYPGRVSKLALIGSFELLHDFIQICIFFLACQKSSTDSNKKLAVFREDHVFRSKLKRFNKSFSEFRKET